MRIAGRRLSSLSRWSPSSSAPAASTQLSRIQPSNGDDGSSRSISAPHLLNSGFRDLIRGQLIPSIFTFDLGFSLVLMSVCLVVRKISENLAEKIRILVVLGVLSPFLFNLVSLCLACREKSEKIRENVRT